MEHASLQSQLKDAPCTVEDTEEIFWLRELDDCQSLTSLGNALAAQYRFKDAIDAYQKALQIRDDDWMLWNRLAGSYLTLLRFKEAKDCYDKCLALKAPISSAAYPIGVWHFLSGDYESAADWFAKCLPCSDELGIAVLYWHALSCYRAGLKPQLLAKYHTGMNVGHHTAYELAVKVFCALSSVEDAVEWARKEDDLNAVILLYGVCVYLEQAGQTEESLHLRKELLEKDSCWPCISYLAAWNDLTDSQPESPAD